MSHEFEREVRTIAGLLDSGNGQQAADRLRQDIYQYPRAGVDLINAVNQTEQNGLGSDLVVRPVTRQYQDSRTGQFWQQQEYLVSVRTPVGQNGRYTPDGIYIDEGVGNCGGNGNFRGPVDRWGRPLPNHGGQFDEYGRPCVRPPMEFQQRLAIQEDIATIGPNGSIRPLQARPYYVEIDRPRRW